MSMYIIEVGLGICLVLTIILLYTIVLYPSIVSMYKYIVSKFNGLVLGNKTKRRDNV